MILKHFILSSIVLIILFIIQKLDYHFSNHNLSLYGFKSDRGTYATFYVYSIIYCIIWGIYVIKVFLEWYYNIKIN